MANMSNSSVNIPESENSNVFLQGISKRNTVFSIITLVLTITTVPILLNAKLKMPIKASLMNMSLNNFITVIIGVVYGTLIQVNYKSDEATCQAFLFLIVYCFLFMHVSVFWISLNNFLAVRYPFRYRSFICGKYVALITITSWLGTASICAATTWGHFLDGLPCFSLIALPRFGLIIIVVFMLSFDSCVVVLNIIICQMLYSRRNKIFARKMNNTIRQPSLVYSGSSLMQSDSGVGGCSGSGTQSQNQSQTQPSTSTREVITPICSKDIKEAYIRSSIASENQHSPSTDVEILSFRRLNSWTIAEDQLGEDVDIALRNPKDSLKRQISSGGAYPPGISAKNTLPVPDNQSRLRSLSVDELPTPSSSLSENAVTDPADTKDTPGLRQFRRATEQSISLFIISVWCFVLNMPFLLYTFYVAAFAEDRVEATFSPLGVAATTATTVNVLGDPFLYAWRFVRWNELYAKIRTVLARGTR